MIQQAIRRDPATALIRALIALAGPGVELQEHRGTSWASATFAGMRHVLRLHFAGADAVAQGDQLARRLGDQEFTIAGHIVADIAVRDTHRRCDGEPALTLTIEALTVEDA
ncbi:hypothetical protein [Blastomonas sp.]|uniref:hypothetical protein n=1 Tax=Blastomonas sp. TaxID=1909299 RepID=UPI003593C4A8